jgi:hypothetical protein
MHARGMHAKVYKKQNVRFFSTFPFSILAFSPTFAYCLLPLALY